MQNKKILITGVCGFLGSNLLKELVDKNTVIGVDNFEYSDRETSKNIIRDIQFFEGDVSDWGTFEKLPKDFDYIFHFGSPSSIILFKKNLYRCYTETVLGTLNVFEFAKKINVEKVIIPSSGSVYAGNELPHSEKVIPKPLNWYAAAKMACEALAFSYSPFVNFCALRIFAGYGPGEERKGDFASVVYIFLNSISKKIPPIVYGDGTQERDFIYVDDVVTSVIKSAEINYTGVLNVGSGISTSFNELVSLVNEILGENVTPRYIQEEKNYVKSIRADITLYKKILNIKLTPIKEGIEKFAQYLNLI